MDRLQMTEGALEDILYDTESPTETVFSEEQWTSSMDAFNRIQCLKELKDSPADKEIRRQLHEQVKMRRASAEACSVVDEKKVRKNLDLELALYAERIYKEMIDGAIDTPRPILAKQ
jgi:hypothetical protein